MWVLMTTDLNTSSIKTKQNYTKIADLDAPAYNLIDWVARNLYWIQINNQTSNIMKLDLTLWQIGTVKPDIVLKINGPKFFNILPSIRYSDNTNIDKPLIYWTSKDRLIATDIYGCVLAT